MIRWLSEWPLIRQIRDRADGNGPESMSARTRALGARTAEDGVEVARSVCPYCGVGCGQVVHHRDGEILSIEGDPESPINQGTLCPKGAASRELLTHEHRLTRVLYRAPRSTRWEPLELERAMDLVADRVWDSRKRTLVATTADLPEDDPCRAAGDAPDDSGAAGASADGGGHAEEGPEEAAPPPGARRASAPEPVNHTAAVCHLGGATLDNEENYLIKKLFTAGMGMVAVSNQARI